MSTTSLPIGSELGRTHSAPALRVEPPVLASQMLRDEVAPIAPARRLVRVLLSAFAAFFALVAAAAWTGLAPPLPGLVAGAVATSLLAGIAAAVPAPYAGRAGGAAFTGVAPLLLGALGLGPLAAIGYEGTGRALAALVPATALAGALIFRGRYRALREARLVLALALVACAPAVWFLAASALDVQAPLAARLADAALVVSASTAFFGFMGAETTAGCAIWAGLVLTVHAGRIAAAAWTLSAPRFDVRSFMLASAGDLAASSLAAFALYQLLAVAFGERARQVDVHQIASREPDEGRLE
jgi:hypothetical protein